MVRFTCICAVLVAGLGVARAFGLPAPPRLSFAVSVAPEASNGFDGYGDAETLTAADLNGDGRADLAVGSSQDQAIWLALSAPGGALAIQRAEYRVDGLPAGLVAGDVTGDGTADLVVATSNTSAVSVLVNDGEGRFAPAVEYDTAASPVSVALADLDGDHKLDAVTADADRKALSVLLNHGDGTLERKVDYTTELSPVAVAAGDLDGNGGPDLVTANTSGSVSVLLNRGDGSFRAKADYAAAGAPNSLALADFDRDGFLDAVVASPRAPRGKHVTVLLGRGDGTFRLRRHFPVRVFASRLTSGDLNGDGSPDLVFSDGGALAVMLNRGDATFQGPLWFGLADTLAAGDFNGDGRLDLAGAWVNDRNGAWSVTVHRNRPGLCNVQDLRGRTLAAATDLLTRADCTVGPVRRARSRTVHRDRVLSQSPRFPGSVLPAGGQVSLVLSLGRR